MYTFVGHDNWKTVFQDENKIPSWEIYFKENKKIVIVKRGILFFYAGEITTLERIRANYTDLAINKLVHDKFIEIKD